MTTETSNARGEWVLVPRVPTDAMLRVGVAAATAASSQPWLPVAWAAMLAAAPPPAAARGDVRGLVAKWRAEAERDQRAANELRESGDREVAVLRLGYATVQHECANELEAALAAEGVQAGGVEQRARELLRQQYIKRGHTEDTAQVMSGYIELHEPAAFSAIVAALSQQPEARGVVDEAMVERAREAYFNAAEVKDGVFTDPVAMRAALTAALTGERNG